MHDSDNSPPEYTKSDESLLTIIETVIFNAYNITSKDGYRVPKINGMFADVGKPFVFIPFELHRLIATIFRTRSLVSSQAGSSRA